MQLVLNLRWPGRPLIPKPASQVLFFCVRNDRPGSASWHQKPCPADLPMDDKMHCDFCSFEVVCQPGPSSFWGFVGAERTLGCEETSVCYFREPSDRTNWALGTQTMWSDKGDSLPCPVLLVSRAGDGPSIRFFVFLFLPESGYRAPDCFSILIWVTVVSASSS